MNYPDLKIHPLCAKLRPHTPEEAKLLKQQFDDAGEFDAKFPIVLAEHKGEEKIIAGRHRYKEAKRRGWDVSVKRFKGDDDAIARFVALEQLGRRNLDKSERAATVAMFRESLGLTIEEAASVANVSISQMQKASGINSKSPELLKKAIAKELTIHDATKRLARTTPVVHDPNAVQWEETSKAFDTASAALREWQATYLDPLLARPGGEHLAASLRYDRSKADGSKKSGIDLVDGLIETLRATKPRTCPDCDGAKCQSCKRLGHVSASENAGRKGRNKAAE